MCDFAVTLFVGPSVSPQCVLQSGLLVKWSERQISINNTVVRPHSLYICSQHNIKSVDNLVYHQYSLAFGL